MFITLVANNPLFAAAGSWNYRGPLRRGPPSLGCILHKKHPHTRTHIPTPCVLKAGWVSSSSFSSLWSSNVDTTPSVLLIDQKTFKEDKKTTGSVTAAIRDVGAAVPLESCVVKRSYCEFVEQCPQNVAHTIDDLFCLWSNCINICIVYIFKLLAKWITVSFVLYIVFRCLQTEQAID